MNFCEKGASEAEKIMFFLQRYKKIFEIELTLLSQVQAEEMYGALHTDLAKSETTWDIKIIITHHLYIYKSCVFIPNLEGVTEKISLPCPWEVWNGQGPGSVIFQATLFKFCGKFNFNEILNW